MRDASMPRASFGHCENTAVLSLKGQIRHISAGALRAFVDEVVSADASDTVLIDLRGVEFIDSTGLGLLARIGRSTLQLHGRRAVIVCPNNDVATTLHSAAFDKLFVMSESYPFDEPADLTTVPLQPPDDTEAQRTQGRVILEAHQDLSALCEQNREAFKDVIAALETELRASRRQ